MGNHCYLWLRKPDNSHADTGSRNWGNVKVNHQPIGWSNSQLTVARDEDLGQHPYRICPMSLTLANSWFKGEITPELWLRSASDKELTKWVENRVFYSVIGVAATFDQIRNDANAWPAHVGY